MLHHPTLTPLCLTAFYRPDRATASALPLLLSPVSAGFPSPAEDSIEGTLDLNAHLITHPAATFFVRATGTSMLEAGIHPGDLLVVDRALTPVDRSVVIAVIESELTVKRLRKVKGRFILTPDNKTAGPLELPPEGEILIWGW